jgi:porin
VLAWGDFAHRDGRPGRGAGYGCGTAARARAGGAEATAGDAADPGLRRRLDETLVSGDWGGTRTDLANKGLTFDLIWAQVGQGVVSGGNRIDWDFGGTTDLVVRADLMRMGVLPMAVVTFRGESRYGETVNDDAGAVMPVNTDGFMPITDRLNQGVPFTITELNYLQMFTPQFGITLGRFQTLDGDPNEFASGRGVWQFLNGNFNFSAVGLLTVPYATLGGGVVWLPNQNIKVSSLAIETKDSSTTTGFDKLNQGWTWSTEADFQYRLGSLPGGQNVAFIYAFSGDFTELNGRLSLFPRRTQVKENESWAVTWSQWQYIYTAEEPKGPINAGDGRPDLKGLGIFARMGFADQDTNPISFMFSGGLGGRGLIPGRDEDSFGVGYFYGTLQNERGFAALGLENKAQGLEAFYNIAVTRAAGVTLDVQWIDTNLAKNDPAVVVGMRTSVRF